MAEKLDEYKSVLADLEKASVADRWIDAAIAIAVGYIKEYAERNGEHGHIRGYEGPSGKVPYSAPWWPESREFPPKSLEAVARGNGVPKWTESLDATIALVERVLPGWDWEVSKKGWGAVWEAGRRGETEHVEFRPVPPPLALLTAMFRAKIAQMENADG